MFKNLNNLFEKKRNRFNISQDKAQLIKEKFKNFLEFKFGKSLKGFSFNIKYTSQDDSLVIVASNKIIANELTMHLADLYEVLKKDNLQVKRILIQ